MPTYIEQFYGVVNIDGSNKNYCCRWKIILGYVSYFIGLPNKTRKKVFDYVSICKLLEAISTKFDATFIY